MKTEKTDKGVRELFRHKLENAELIPSPSVKQLLMKRVARKEFMRFNPARFNIYYLSGLVAATFTAAILIFSDGVKSEDFKNSTVTKITTEKDIKNEVISIPAGKTITRDKDTTVSKIDKSGSQNVKTEQKLPAFKDISADSDKPKEVDVNLPAQNIEAPQPKPGFKVSAPEDKSLKGGYVSGGVLFEPSANSGCLPLKLRFKNLVKSVDSCKWTFGDGGFSNEVSPEWIFDVEGDYKVGLEVWGTDGSYSNYSTTITVHPKPQARFEFSPEKPDLPDEEVLFLNYSTGSEKYYWNFGDGSVSSQYEPRHKYSKFGNYNVRLIAVSQFGCTDTLVFVSPFSGSEYSIEFPNAFIPNPDGPSGGYYSSKSDEAALVFHPSYSGISEYQLRVFTKVGQLLFESNDINIGWDGYYKGELVNPGVFIWKVRGNFRNGEPFVKMGDVTLLRK